METTRIVNFDPPLRSWSGAGDIVLILAAEYEEASDRPTHYYAYVDHYHQKEHVLRLPVDHKWFESIKVPNPEPPDLIVTHTPPLKARLRGDYNKSEFTPALVLSSLFRGGYGSQPSDHFVLIHGSIRKYQDYDVLVDEVQ